MALTLVLVLGLVMVLPMLLVLALPGQVLILVHALEVIPLLVLVLGMALVVLGCWYCWYLVLVPALTMVLVMVVAGGV